MESLIFETPECSDYLSKIGTMRWMWLAITQQRHDPLAKMGIDDSIAWGQHGLMV